MINLNDQGQVFPSANQVQSDNGGPAFPSGLVENANDEVDALHALHKGMTLRDYFAANAMQGMLAGAERGLDADIAKYAYKLADAMLRARDAA